MDEYTNMSYDKKKVFKKKKLNRSGRGSTYDENTSINSEEIPYNTAQKSSETISMTNELYGIGKDRPQVFDTIQFINELLEKSNSAWTEHVHSRFNSEI